MTAVHYTSMSLTHRPTLQYNIIRRKTTTLHDVKVIYCKERYMKNNPCAWTPAQQNPQLTKASGPISREMEAITTGAGERPNRVDASL